MKTHDQQSLDDQQRQGGKKLGRAPETQPDSVEGSIRELQATAGNRAVSDLVTGNHPTVQGRFFSGAFGGLEDWMAKDTPAAGGGFDASMKEESGDASVKEQSSDASMKEQPSDYSMKDEPGDASVKEQSSDYSMKADPGDASMKVDDASDKWDASEKLDASEKWDASEKAEPDLASKEDTLESEF
ncbi:MAG TPA: hypothetical protein VIO62_01315 [Candidatus Dormibacteraeota bacterium]